MKNNGIILVGASDSRAYPVTKILLKQLVLIYNRRVIHYLLSILMLVGIRDILIIPTPQDMPRFEQLLANGSAWDIKRSISTEVFS